MSGVANPERVIARQMAEPQGPDFSAALQKSGFFEVKHPLNINGRQATATITALTLLVATACNETTTDQRVKDLQNKSAKFEQDAKDIQEQQQQIERELAEVIADHKAVNDHQPQESNKPAAADTAVSPSPELQRQETAEEAQGRDAKQRNLYTDTVITRALVSTIQEGSRKEYGEIIHTLLKGMLHDDIYTRLEEKETTPDGYTWYYFLDFAELDGADIKAKILSFVGNDRKQFEKLIADIIATIYKLPADLQIKLVKRAVNTLPAIIDAFGQYRKYKKILDHHDAWLLMHSAQTSDSAFTAYKDPCRDPKLHMEYENEVAKGPERAPLDPNTKQPLVSPPEHPDAMNRYNNHPFIRAIHDLTKRIGSIYTVERIFHDLQKKITTLQQALGIAPAKQD